MRKVIAYLFISLDGVVESPDKWSFEHFDNGLLQELEEQIAAQDTVLLGRVAYQEWSEYWPSASDEPFASFINSVEKYAISKSLNDVSWNNTKLIKTKLPEEIAKLKAQSGKDIAVLGSPRLTLSMLEQNLLDELRLAVYPVIAGSGKRLFKDNSALKRLDLIESKSTETGVLIVSYKPRQAN